jgi:hypothetical protein
MKSALRQFQSGSALNREFRSLSRDGLRLQVPASWGFDRSHTNAAIGAITNTETTAIAMSMSIVTHRFPAALVTICGNSPCLKIKRFPNAHTA